jgi:hypothetical protein
MVTTIGNLPRSKPAQGKLMKLKKKYLSAS